MMDMTPSPDPGSSVRCHPRESGGPVSCDEPDSRVGGNDEQAVADAPDWDLVRFPVRCPRCDQDLRSVSEPPCPRCGLEFTWADLIPADELKCLNCRYPLFGLPQQRCPECGTEFTWTELLLAQHRRSLFLFEYWWRSRPIRSAWWTWRKALRPGRFWRMVKLHHPPQRGPLFLFAVAALLLGLVAFFVGIVLGQIGTDLYWRSTFGNSIWSSVNPQSLLPSSISLRGVVPSLLHITFWLGCALLALMIFVGSMRRLRLRTVHLVRVWAYSLPIWVPAAVFIHMLILEGTWSWFFGLRSGAMEKLTMIVPVVALVASMWSMRQGLARYVRMPHATAVAICVQLIAVMSALLPGAIITLIRYSGEFG